MKSSALCIALSCWVLLPHAAAQAGPSDPPAAPPASETDAASAAHRGSTDDGSTDEAPALAGEPDVDRGGVGNDPEPARDETAGDDEGFGDDEGDGWGEGDAADAFEHMDASIATIEQAAADEAETPKGTLSVGGFVRHRSGLWVEQLDQRPLAQARTSLDTQLRYKRPVSLFDVQLDYRLVADMHFEYDLAYQVDRSSYDQATLDMYEARVIGGETYLASSFGPLELTFGRQIVAWGQGDLFSPLDVVNPRDLREPGLAELDDIRIAVLASRVGLFFGSHRFELMAIHETNFGLRPAPLSPFSPLRKLLQSQPALAAQLEGLSLYYDHDPDGIALDRRTQWLGRWQYAGPGLDLGLYGARTLDRQGVFVLPDMLPSLIASGELPLRLVHKPYWMIGHAGAKPLGDFVFKWELGFDIDRPLTAQRQGALLSPVAIRSGQLNWLAGVTYSGIEDGSLAFEYSQSYLIDHPERDGDGSLSLLFPVEQPTYGLLFNQTYMRETLSLRVSVAGFGIKRFLGMLARAELTYELQDALQVGMGYVTYQPSSQRFGPLYGLEEHDRLYATLRYDFLLD